MTVTALYGGFKHASSLSPDQIEFLLRIQPPSQVCAILAQNISKVSVALLVLRFTASVSVWRKWALYACISSSLIFGTLNVIFNVIKCKPSPALTKVAQHTHCFDRTVQNRFAIFVGCRSSKHRFDWFLISCRLECPIGFVLSDHSNDSGLEPQCGHPQKTWTGCDPRNGHHVRHIYVAMHIQW